MIPKSPKTTKCYKCGRETKGKVGDKPICEDCYMTPLKTTKEALGWEKILDEDIKEAGLDFMSYIWSIKFQSMDRQEFDKKVKPILIKLIIKLLSHLPQPKGQRGWRERFRQKYFDQNTPSGLNQKDFPTFIHLVIDIEDFISNLLSHQQQEIKKRIEGMKSDYSTGEGELLLKKSDILNSL